MRAHAWLDKAKNSATISQCHGLTYNGVEATEGSANGQTGEAALGDRRVNYALLTKAVEKTFGDLVGTIVLSNLLTEDEDLVVSLELLSKSFVEGISDGVLLDAGGVVGVGAALGRTEEDGTSEGGALGEGRSSGCLGSGQESGRGS